GAPGARRGAAADGVRPAGRGGGVPPRHGAVAAELADRALHGHHERPFGRLEEGAEYGRRATQLDPLNSTAYVYLARTLDALGRYDEAEAVLHKAVELQPEAAQSYCELATV